MLVNLKTSQRKWLKIIEIDNSLKLLPLLHVIKVETSVIHIISQTLRRWDGLVVRMFLSHAVSYQRPS